MATPGAPHAPVTPGDPDTNGLSARMPEDAQIPAAREAFPTGLDQPEGGYRFSLDPLLLAAFARPKKNVRVADLGTGCGVAALALLLSSEAISHATGIDVDPAMTRAAAANAARLGLTDHFAALTLDVRDTRGKLPPESFGLALCNPPYREPGTGLACDGDARNRARFATQGSLEDFLNAATYLLANRGSLCVVYPAARLDTLLVAGRGTRLTPKRLRMAHSRLDGPAKLCLVEFIKNAGDEMAVEPPLVLYRGRGERTRMTRAALSFCPFLARNP